MPYRRRGLRKTRLVVAPRCRSLRIAMIWSNMPLVRASPSSSREICPLVHECGGGICACPPPSLSLPVFPWAPSPIPVFVRPLCLPLSRPLSLSLFVHARVHACVHVCLCKSVCLCVCSPLSGDRVWTCKTKGQGHHPRCIVRVRNSLPSENPVWVCQNGRSGYCE